MPFQKGPCGEGGRMRGGLLVAAAVVILLIFGGFFLVSQSPPFYPFFSPTPFSYNIIFLNSHQSKKTKIWFYSSFTMEQGLSK